MEAVTSGRYDTDHLALIMSQTGGCCRASNYIAFIRRALKKAGLEHIPVISLNANGMETNEGFRISPSLLLDAAHGIVLGDLLMRCLYRVRPYELEKAARTRCTAGGATSASTRSRASIPSTATPSSAAALSRISTRCPSTKRSKSRASASSAKSSSIHATCQQPCCRPFGTRGRRGGRSRSSRFLCRHDL